MIKLDSAVVVEGKYDKIKLESVVDALILTTDGFGIFNNTEKQRFLRRLADERGIIIMTDSDSAGFLIRSKLCSILPKEKIVNVYIPEILGKERRKQSPSKEGLLGVEGVDGDIIMSALARAGVTGGHCDAPTRRITKADMYQLGLSGREDSANLRQKLQKALDLPKRMSSNALLAALNIFMTYDELNALCCTLTGDENG